MYEIAPEISNSAEQRVQITAFADDSAVLAEHVPGESVLPNKDTTQHTDSMIHSVISFLERPQLVSSFQWSPSALRSQNILTLQGSASNPFKIPYSLMTNMIKNKLDGFTSFRATCVLQLEINAQPFQCGRLILVAVPMPDLLLDRAKFILSHVTLAQTVNHVQIDISKQTKVILRVPFLSPFNSFDLINVQYNWAQVAVLVYSPLNEVEQVPLGCLLWAHFEDIELGAPTSGVCPIPAQEQAGKIPNRARAQKSESLKSGSGEGKFRAPPKEASPKAIAVQRANESDGVFASSARSFGARLSSTASSFIGGVTDAVCAVTNFLGWSKPQLDHSGDTVVIRPTQYFGNTDGIDHSQVLSLNVMNNVDAFEDLCGTDLDECSFEYIKRVPQYVGKFNFSSSNKYNDKLFQTYVTPTYSVPAVYYISLRDAQATGATANSNYAWFQPNSLRYAISPFAYWTGSLVYTLRFVKTNYHSGRVEVSYHPFVNDIRANRFAYVYRVIVDLRINTEASFTIPYISPQPWKSIDATFDPLTTTKPPDTYLRSFTGIFYIRAITALEMASSIVPSTIECLVEVRAGDDFKVSCPVNSPYMPYAFSNKTPVPKQQSGEVSSVYAVPGTQDTRTRALEGFVPASITGNNRDILRPDTQMYTAGEIFDNYRALSRRFQWNRTYEVSAGRVLAIDPVKFIRPPYITYTLNGLKKAGSDPPTYDKTAFQIDFEMFPTPLNFVSGMFCYYRGGVRIKINHRNPTTPATLLSGRLMWYQTTADTTLPDYIKPTVPSFMCPVQYESPNQKRFCEFQVPYYSPTLVSIHWNNNRDILFDQPLPWVEINTNSNTTAQVLNAASAASDDMDFQLFIGPPPVVSSANYPTNEDAGDIVVNQFTSRYGYNADPTYLYQPQLPPTGWVQMSTGTISMSDIRVVDQNSGLS
jgi:hypothetical protein